ncbi:Putative F0F1-ATPase subunit Ca2+/Mg2+ transporter [Paenibacillus sp. UNCCL117]|uniref:AtpZ/AtpI family protein n=1 Tax=unclassified Paenibacillus TaxID=185978 RepID=UPI000889F38B|nr:MULTISPECIES: AtpZ/AtpI family protein [unclassified Paenibacillus]SDE33661.1 Putative F0F1-ATPase subunit Ca2+/Mg2+ transporter [Paenibacillus sp. cl123]SFW64074.1 Putative F0F1-ATPase subunit Ca2+/Mg2+ transporter [Paenibacillus sp. UNCCL117]
MSRQNSNDNPWRAAALVSALGVDIVLCTAIGYFVGKWIGSQSDASQSWVIGGVMVGFAVGIVTSVLVVKTFLEDKPSKHE